MKNVGNSIIKIIEEIVQTIYSKIFKKELSDEKRTNLIQFIKFGFVGLSNTGISYIVYLILLYFGIQYIWASVISYFISIINAFYWNNKYVFNQRQSTKRDIINSFIKTFISYAGTGLVVQNLLLFLWVDILSISNIIAPIINLVITIPLNFILNKLWAFKK